MPAAPVRITAAEIRRCPLAIANGHHYRPDGSCLCLLDLAACPRLGHEWDAVSVAWSHGLTAARMLAGKS